MKNYGVYFGFKKRGREFEQYLICEENSIDYKAIMMLIDNSKFDLNLYRC